jgi:PKD domain
MVLVAFSNTPSSAQALILPPFTVDGPSSQIVEFGGVAMAPDGTGGLVYTKIVEGIAHVFVSRYVAGNWSTPVRVDWSDPFEASQPRISAGPHGALEVVWVSPVATVEQQVRDGLWSASLGSGAEGFGNRLLVDANVGDGNGVDPSLAGFGAGKTIVAYRVVTNNFSKPTPGAVRLRPGDVLADIRVARFAGDRWSRLGNANRNPAASMRPPTSTNGPQVAVGPTGNAVLIWQEPDQTGTSRIWARRVFASTLGPVYAVSPTSWEGKPIEEEADSFSLAVTAFEQARIAVHIAGKAGSSLGGPAIFLYTFGSSGSTEGAKPEGPVAVALPGSGGTPGPLAYGSVAASGVGGGQGLLRLAFGTGTGIAQQEVETDGQLKSIAALPGPALLGGAAPATSVGPDGSGVLAYAAAEGGLAVQQSNPSGAAQTATISGVQAGPVSQLDVGRSGLGDALLGFRQGEPGSYEIVGDAVSAPPSDLILRVPKRWQRPGQVMLRWIAPSSAVGDLHYAVLVGGRSIKTGIRRLRFHPAPAQLGDGALSVQVLATDELGETDLSPVRKIKVDGTPPQAKLHLQPRRGALTVRLTDSGSGLAPKSAVVRFGDGDVAHGGNSFKHTYADPGTYTVTIRARDRVGNRLHTSYRVGVR